MSRKVLAALREQAVQEALKPYDTIALWDFIALMNDAPLKEYPTLEQVATIEVELMTAGFFPTFISEYGHEAIFPRFQRAAINQLRRYEAAEAIYD
jgi:hypothetical protein